MAEQTQHETYNDGKRREKAKNLLKGYRDGVTVNGQLLKLIADAESRLSSATAQYEETRSSGMARDALADHIASLEDVIGRLRMEDDILKDNLDDLLIMVTKATVINPSAGAVLAALYMEPGEAPSMDEVAERLYRGIDRVKQLHRAGLDIVADLMGE